MLAIASHVRAIAGVKSIGGAAQRCLLMALLGAAALLATAFARGDASDRRSMPLALPKALAVKPLWTDERAAFAGRLKRGYGLASETAEEFAGWILEASARQHLQPELVASLVMAESSFRKHVRSPMGAVGPAQVRADLWHSFCGGDLSDPEQNLYCGVQILAYYQEVCARTAGSAEQAERCALRSYNVGYGNRDNVYFLEAAARYVAKIDRYRAPLNEV